MNINDSTIIDTKLIELETNRKTYKKNKTVPAKRKSIFLRKPQQENKKEKQKDKNDDRIIGHIFDIMIDRDYENRFELLNQLAATLEGLAWVNKCSGVVICGD